ncbi:MAG: SIR2 family protein [Bryobacterales bacterium]
MRRSLEKDAQHGGMTLVLGAGVSLSRGLRSWRTLVQAMWARVLGNKPMPPWLAGGGGVPHPLAYQIVFEELEHCLRAEALASDPDADPIGAAERRFAALITEELYRGFVPKGRPDDTLAIIAKLIRSEQAAPDPRIARVITFNADDLLEMEANRGFHYQRDPVVWAVPRASFHPRRGNGANGRPPIPVYHLHGYLPRLRNTRAAPDTLVFTDSEYWRSVANPGSFANRTLANALQDSHCIFIGLSMEDVNLMRWLGLRQVEVEDDYLSRQEADNLSAAKSLDKIRRALNRHFWITTASADPSRLIASHLERRGVGTILLDDWDGPFQELIESTFPRRPESP